MPGNITTITFFLAKPPEEITLKEVVYTLEGSLSLTECVESPEVCDRVNFCVTRDLWCELSERMGETLKSKTLKDLVENHRSKQKNRPLVYNI